MDSKPDSLELLLKNMHTELGKDSRQEAKFAMHDLLANYLLDSSRPPSANAPQIIAHIKERTAMSFSYGVNRRARALGLSYQSARGKVILRNNADTTAYLANDGENSGLLLLDVAISRLLERRSGKFVGSTYNIFARLASMNSKRYYEGVPNQHTEYMNRCMQYPKAFKEKVMKVDDLFGANGEPNVAQFEGNVAIALDGILPKDMLVKLFDICGQKQACLRYQPFHKAEGRMMLEQHPEVLPHLIDDKGEVTVYQYTPLSAHPTYPLVSGPEDDFALAKVERLLEAWLEGGTLVEDHRLLDPLVRIDSAPTMKAMAPVVTETVRDMVMKDFVDPPQSIREIYFTVLRLPYNQMKAMLDSRDIKSSNANIFSISNGNHLPTSVVQATRQAVEAGMNPSALEILMRVHWALSNVKLYIADVHHRLPKDPWRAAVFLVIRQPARYGIKGLTYDPQSGDWMPTAPEAAAAGAGSPLKHAKISDWSLAVEEEDKKAHLYKDPLFGRTPPSGQYYTPPRVGTTESGICPPFGHGYDQGRRTRSKSRPRVQFSERSEDALTLRYSGNFVPPTPRGGAGRGRGRGVSLRARGGMPRTGSRPTRREPIDIGALVTQMNSQFSAHASVMQSLTRDMNELKTGKASQAKPSNM